MTTSTLEVGNLFSVLGAQGIEKQLQRIAGVGRVAVIRHGDKTKLIKVNGKTAR